MALIGFILLIIIADQLSKLWVVKHISGGREIVLIKDFFSLNYVENRGAAFGLWHNSPAGSLFLKVFSLLLTGALIYILTQVQHKGMRYALASIIAGSIGNLIDRFFRSYVVDFLSFKFASYIFPSFNLADSAIVLGAFCLAIIFIFDEKAYDELSSVLSFLD